MKKVNAFGFMMHRYINKPIQMQKHIANEQHEKAVQSVCERTTIEKSVL